MLTRYARLTVVAFVYIPLNFATSFFGMNLRELGTPISMQWFSALAVIAGTLTCGIVMFTGSRVYRHYLHGLHGFVAKARLGYF